MCTQLVFIAAFSLALAGSSFAGSDNDVMPGSVAEQSPSGTDASKDCYLAFCKL
jgi:hypothetical protein